MEINKTYDITELGNKVQEAIESCVAGKSNRCSIDLLTANEILEVLRETKVREDRIKEQKTEHLGCFEKYNEDNLDCLICPCGNKCLKETERTEIVRVSYCSEVGCKFNSATKCITTPEMRVQNNECMSNTCSTRYLIPDDNIVSEDEEEGETNE